MEVKAPQWFVLPRSVRPVCGPALYAACSKFVTHLTDPRYVRAQHNHYAPILSPSPWRPEGAWGTA